MTREHGLCDPGPALAPGFVQPRLSRRQLLRSAGVGAGALALFPFLAACGENERVRSQGSDFDWGAQDKSGELRFGNWPLYLDRAKVGGEVVHPSLERFEQETGIIVDYREVIDDYASWFGKLQPQLAAGQPTGFDLIVMGYPRWLPLMIHLGYVIPLDHSYLSNFDRNAAPKYRNASYDPGNRYSVPWQSGITGIGYNIELTRREVTSLQDLFNPEFRGRVGMFGDTEDTPNMALLALGVEPTTSTPSDWQEAADLLTKQRDDGIVRQYYGQPYLADLRNGNIALSLAWAADVLQSQISGFHNLRFVVPDEGALLWTDSLCIPIGAAHPVDAITFMDFVYRPEVAAMITGWIQNVSPVPQAQTVLLNEGDTSVARNPLVFPTPDTYDRLKDYRVLDEDEQRRWDELFLAIYR